MSEVLKLLKPVRKSWLEALQKYRVTIEYESGVEATPSTLEVSDSFGLGIDKRRKFKIYDDFEVDISPKDIVYITGDSGSCAKSLTPSCSVMYSKHAYAKK